MTPARSVAASLVALGFASTLTPPLPAAAAPLPCGRALHYAAQSGAEVLRINKLDAGRATASPAGTRASPGPEESGEILKDPKTDSSYEPPMTLVPSEGPDVLSDDGAERPDPVAESAGPDDSVEPSAGRSNPSPEAGGPADRSPSDKRSPAGERTPADKRTPAGGSAGSAEPLGDIGLGDVRSVMIADNPVASAGAARVLNGKADGRSANGETVTQQAPPSHRKATERRTGERRFGPLRAGAGTIGAHARWRDGLACGTSTGEVSSAQAALSRVTLAGGGSASLVRAPEKLAAISGTALRASGGDLSSEATATVTGGRITLVDGAVRLRLLKPPVLRVTMSTTAGARVAYQPATLEVTTREGRPARLTTAGDHADVPLSNDLSPLTESAAPSGGEGEVSPAAPLPVPTLESLPRLAGPESTPNRSSTPDGSGVEGTVLRIALGDVRQATKGKAAAAKATAIHLSVARGTGQSSTVVADLGLGVLEAAAVAPETNAAPGLTGAPATGSDAGSDAGSGSGTGTGAPAAGLPVTGPGTAPLFLTGAGLIVGGVVALLAGTRRRRTEP
ncbi:hypothetical protein [Actinoplanes sp. NBRC 101535]|uniref:hypothetical protein n=1 Tax=Actinoplanes sp. NBRC 101535 TaxID=3032196 RepID=UPI0024A415E2|nr:hypothetical protein [Actinoplanes sp. NBRC 101535]GLY05887.1 hypothetical protein Acsp01_62660 [Actinoplanes sp. NBRC 101535]